MANNDDMKQLFVIYLYRHLSLITKLGLSHLLGNIDHVSMTEQMLGHRTRDTGVSDTPWTHETLHQGRSSLAVVPVAMTLEPVGVTELLLAGFTAIHKGFATRGTCP